MKTLTIKITDLPEGQIEIEAALPNHATIKDVLQALGNVYESFSDDCQKRFGCDTHQEFLEFLKDNPEAGDFTVEQLNHKD